MKLRKAAQSSTADLNKLLQKYAREQDPNIRGLLKSILFGVHKPEVARFALGLTRSSNPLHRVEGFELLRQLPGGERELHQAALLNTLRNDDEYTKQAALYILRDFNLSKEEKELHSQVHAALNPQ